jgi:hypothetical protein
MNSRIGFSRNNYTTGQIGEEMLRRGMFPTGGKIDPAAREEKVTVVAMGQKSARFGKRPLPLPARWRKSV